MGKAKAEASTILLAAEATYGTNPGSGAWQQVGVNPGGITDWIPKLKTVERDPLSKYASREKGDNVGLDAEPKLTHDLNKEWGDLHWGPVFRCAAKHAGNKGQSFYRPTAVVDGGGSNDSFTVAALGDLSDGLLIYTRGFTNSANNGLFVLAGTSTSTAIKVATGTLVAEASPPANATLEVAGVQGTSGDVQLDASGDLIATTLDFTTLGLNVGQWIKIGGTATNTAFATSAYNGRARIKTIAAGKLTLERRTWTVGSADTGTGKTIQVFFTRFFRNVPIDHADYLEPSLHGELEELGPGTSSAGTYTYVPGMAPKTFEIDAALESKIVCTASYIAKDVEDPVLVASRKTGASTAYAPLAAALIDTATDLKKVRLTDSTGELVAEVNSWKLTFENNIKGRKVQGTFGNLDLIYGKFEPMVSMEAYYTDFNATKAIRDNRDLAWDAYVQNHQVALLFDMPNVALRGGARSFPANDAVMISCEVPGFRDSATNIVASLSVFAHIPA
jgi:hypothetical protein